MSLMSLSSLKHLRALRLTTSEPCERNPELGTQNPEPHPRDGLRPVDASSCFRKVGSFAKRGTVVYLLMALLGR